MSDTPQLSLPLLAAAQAQKHVTMNEALTRLDALTSPVVLSRTTPSAPAIADDGDAYLVPPDATGAWAGKAHQMAFHVNNGWSYAVAKPGWRVWVTDRNCHATFGGTRWVDNLVGPFSNGAYMDVGLIEGDVTLSGDVVTSTIMIPDRAVVLGISARVTQTITGSASGWQLGVDGAANRYGSGIGVVQDSTAIGVTGTPVAYYGATPVQIAAEGGPFTGGVIRLAVHYFNISPPDAV